ncbi:DUF6207 family protein [Streptomyces sp. WAC01526]|uniref:DUF6207 family protein n=1 Tax=Streptomyces sp. WAC01526 TaxID=2588709 RepID=UPI0037DD24A6
MTNAPPGGVCQAVEIHEEHLREPGLVVINITSADEQTATQAAASLGELWHSTPGMVSRPPDHSAHQGYLRAPDTPPALQRAPSPRPRFAGRAAGS